MLNVTAMTKAEIEACPIRNVLANINGKWQPLILLSLEEGPLRFSAIKRAIGDITQRVQTQNPAINGTGRVFNPHRRCRPACCRHL